VPANGFVPLELPPVAPDPPLPPVAPVEPPVPPLPDVPPVPPVPPPPVYVTLVTVGRPLPLPLKPKLTLLELETAAFQLRFVIVTGPLVGGRGDTELSSAPVI
jgi:hypothetical protein